MQSVEKPEPGSRKSGVKEAPIKPEAVEAVKSRIRENPGFALDVLREIYSQGTDEEKKLGEDTGTRDGRGLSPIDIWGMSRMAWRLQKRGYLLDSETDSVQRCMEKYSRQYLKIVRERIRRRVGF